MGTRNKEGVIVPLSMQSQGPKQVEGTMDTDGGVTQELLFTGRAECVPDSVQRLVNSLHSRVILFPITTPRFRLTKMQKDGLVAFRRLKWSLHAVALLSRPPALFPLRILPCKNTLW
jgi:hypothetical protein